VPTESSSTGASALELQVERPPPGLARGRWEAPAWLFWATAAAVVAAGVIWFARAARGRWQRAAR
jgi:hypothetical protein